LSDPTNFSEQLQQALSYDNNGQSGKAAAIYRDILTRQPDHYEANYALGMLLHKGSRNDLAMPLIKKSVELRPDIFEGRFNLGLIQRDEGLLADSQVNLERAVALRPDNAKARVTLGMLYADAGKLDLALKEIKHGLRLDPDNPKTYARMGMLRQIRGEMDAAVAYYRRMIELAPNDATAYRSLTFLQKQTEYNDDIKWMEDAFGAADCSNQDRILLGFALGKVFDDLGLYDKAFDYIHTANQLQRQSSTYSMEEQKALFERHKQGLNHEFMSHCKDHVIIDNTPIFVLGMPRSGTSLVEQILASHPLVFGGGEVEHTRCFADAVENFTGKPFPLGIGEVSPDILGKAGQFYLQQIKLNAGQAERVIDKLPHNFLRVGVIAAVMPNAKIILCERNPLDNCLSIYQQKFVRAHGYASDLAELGHYYRLYQDLADWWEEILPGHIYRLSYEQLVRETESQVRKLLEYCELPFHENCLSFHRTRRQVKTPSAVQVRQPVYQDSISRWKNYEKHLAPLQEALGPIP